MRGFYFIDCDIDGHGKRWRLADVQETASVDGSYLMATFVDDGDFFQEGLDVFRKNGSRIVGPITTEQLLTCIEIAEYVAVTDQSFLPQVKAGERPIKAARANGLMHAAHLFLASSPAWKRENFQ